MASVSKSSTVTRLDDGLLGCLRQIQPSETLDHLVRFLGTWSGSDKFFMVVQYVIKLIVPILRLRARLQYGAGLRKVPTSRAAEGYAKLGSLLGDSRTLWQIWGLLPIFQWLISLERNPQPTRKLHIIERLQACSMLAYYPLEHLSYLGSHGIIPTVIKNPLAFLSKKKYISLDPPTLGVWSCRLWALYVFLQFAHLREDRKLLELRRKALRRAKGTGLTPSEKQEIAQRSDAWWSEVLVNLGFLPLTIHGSLEQGLFKDDLWVGIFGLVAGIASFRSGWRATALPPATPPPPPEIKGEESASPYEISS